VFEIINEYGFETLGPMLVVAGLLQVIAGKFKFGQWFRAISPAVIYGMLSGIGVLIFASQFHVMVDDVPKASGLTNLFTIPQAIAKGLSFSDSSPHHLAAMVGAATFGVLVAWNMIRSKLPGGLSLIPAPLLAVGFGVFIAKWMAFDINFVSVPKSFDALISFPTLDGAMRLLEPKILGSALAMGIIASAEALLCAMAVDKLHDGVRSKLDQELSAQGLGNIVAGLVGALPITGVIVRSTANVEAGAKTRVSAILHGVWLVIAILAIPFVLEAIPVASLAAVLVYIGYRLFRPEVAIGMIEKGKGEAIVYFTTVIAIVATNLLDGLLIGFVVAVVKLAWSLSNISITSEVDDANRRIDLHLNGSGSFVVVPQLSQKLGQVPWKHEVHVHIETLDYLDHACIELIGEWKHEYEQRGGSVVVEWEELKDRLKAPSHEAA
jgi:MFS superfamily sulfate permease-like transporter